MRALALLIAMLVPLSLWARPATRGEVRAFCDTIEEELSGVNGGYELNRRKCLNAHVVAIHENGGVTLEGVVFVGQPLSDLPDEQPWGCSMKYVGQPHPDNVLSGSLNCGH